MLDLSLLSDMQRSHATLSHNRQLSIFHWQQSPNKHSFWWHRKQT